MHILYFDESGDLGRLRANQGKNMQPVFVLGAVLVPQENLRKLTLSFIRLKEKYLGVRSPATERLESLRTEVKGKSLRKQLRYLKNRAGKELRFLDELLDLLRKLDCRISASIYIKAIDAPFEPSAVYTTAIQKQVDLFQKYLKSSGSMGLVVADSRYSDQNSTVSHAIFTQLYSKRDSANYLVESPVFGNSHNHAGLQITDFVVSSMLVPMALATYCQNMGFEDFNHDFDHAIKLRFAKRIKNLQIKHQFPNGGTRFGIYVNDAVNNWNAEQLFSHQM